MLIIMLLVNLYVSSYFYQPIIQPTSLFLCHFMRKYGSWKQEKEKNAYLIEIEDILPAYSLSCINRNRLRKERKRKSLVTKSFEKR